MKILLVQKFYYLHGGSNRYFFELMALLKKHNHEVAVFSMQDNKNFSSRWSNYFVSNVSFENKGIINSLRFFGRMMYSLEASKKINMLLDDFKPDIIELFDIYHHISLSILPEIRKRKIPIIQRFGDYHYIAPNYNLFHNGKICEITKPKSYYKAILHKCVKNSYIASTIEVIEKYFHNFMGWEEHNIDAYIAPSKFMRSKLTEYGLPEDKIVFLHNFVDFKRFISTNYIGNYVLYFGRLSEEKGLNFLLDVFQKISNVNLLIVGRGFQDKLLKQKVTKLKLKNVKFIKFIDGVLLKKIIRNCRFSVLPSIWYENSPNSILESFASGKPVIASDIGGIPEIVKDGFNGLLFKPGNIEDCKRKILKFWNSPILCKNIGQNARKFVEENYSPDDHYENIMEIYKKAIRIHR